MILGGFDGNHNTDDSLADNASVSAIVDAFGFTSDEEGCENQRDRAEQFDEHMQ